MRAVESADLSFWNMKK